MLAFLDAKFTLSVHANLKRDLDDLRFPNRARDLVPADRRASESRWNTVNTLGMSDFDEVPFRIRTLNCGRANS